MRVMGQDISMPVLISPTGVQAVHPEGEVAVARAAAARGIAMGLSSFASQPIEDGDRDRGPDLLPGLLVRQPRGRSPARLERAKAAGARASS